MNNSQYFKSQINSRKKIVRGNLLAHGLTIPDFAEMHGFNSYTVRNVITRYFGNQEKKRKPYGKITNQIIKTLESYLGEQ